MSRLNIFRQLTDFNSIKVRLRPLSVVYLLSILLHFNSIKVRLRPMSSFSYLIIRLFQFHKGSIKTPKASIIGLSPANFNSIKVRLRHTIGGQSISTHVFQFHKGSIKTYEFFFVPYHQIISIP